MKRSTALTAALAIFLCANLCVAQRVDSSFAGFKKHVLLTSFISEGVAVGDINNDGKPDIVAGPSWFEAPQWRRHDIDTFKIFDPKTTYSRSFLNHCTDVNNDGRVDVIVCDFPGLSAFWFENPGPGSGYWKKHTAYPYVGNESPVFTDVNKDGHDDIICADSRENRMVWLEAPSRKGDTLWKRHLIGAPNVPGTDIQGHGLGYGDLNSDGHPDVIVKDGWWEGPLNVNSENWPFHPADIGEDCSQMYVLDANADGLPDVVSASAHRFGIWWHKQIKEDLGNSFFDHYTISFSSSQTHAVGMADFNHDSHPDIVTGKRYFAHLERLHPSNRSTIDPGTYEEPAVYWFESTPTEKIPWVQHKIDNDSGVGINLATADINGDGKMDIIVANKKGVFYFENNIVDKQSK